MKEIRLEITKQGGMRMLHDDDFNMDVYGVVNVQRASHVEFNNATGCWYVQSAKTGLMLRDNFKSRKDALAWEKIYYSPSQAGWLELIGD